MKHLARLLVLAYAAGLGACTHAATPSTPGGSAKGAASSSPPSPWGDPAWSRRRFVRIQAPGGAPFDDFPVPVVLDAEHVDYAACAERGADLRFVDAAG